MNGKSAWGVVTPQSGWVDPQTQQPIPNFKPPSKLRGSCYPVSRCKGERQSAKYGVKEVTDVDGNLVDVPRLNVIDAFNAGKGYSGKEIKTPTGQEKTRQDFSESGLMQVQTMRDIIERNREFVRADSGGKVQDFAAWVGSNSPDASKVPRRRTDFSGSLRWGIWWQVGSNR